LRDTAAIVRHAAVQDENWRAINSAVLGENSGLVQRDVMEYLAEIARITPP
jgi:hypothetical protein